MDIGFIVTTYNKAFTHRSLISFVEGKATPENAYNSLPKFDRYCNDEEDQILYLKKRSKNKFRL